MLKNKIDNLEKNGFSIFRNIFSDDEMQKLIEIGNRKCSMINYEGSIEGDLINDNEIREIIFKDEVISIMKSIVKNKKLMYFYDSQIHCKPNQRIFHNDARNYDVNPRKKNYPVYRLGIFLQDHTDYSGGIKFRKNSHRRHILNKLLLKNILTGKQDIKDPISFMNFGKIVNAKTRLGDLGIWSLRTQHSGGAVIPKLFNNLGLLPFIDNYIPKILKKPEHKNRIAIFYTFGEDSTALSNYIDYKFENKNDLEHWNKSYVDNNVLEFANSKGFEIHNKIIGYLS